MRDDLVEQHARPRRRRRDLRRHQHRRGRDRAKPQRSARRRRCGGWRRWSPATRPPRRSSTPSPRRWLQLLDAQTSNLVRFDGALHRYGGRGLERARRDPMPVGEQVTFDGPTAVPIVRRTGEAARVDDYSHIEGELAERLRELGLRSTVAAPVTADGRLWGAITVSTIGEHDARPRCGGPDRPVRRGGGACLSSTEARSQLAASRARIVAAGDAERRRLERNLHDGAQQRLVSLALGLRMARSTVGEDSDAAADAGLGQPRALRGARRAA